MDKQFAKFGGLSAIIVGVLSILYAVFYLVISRQAEFIGTFGSWLILALSGLFTSVAYVALYQRTRPAGEGYALWGLLMGVGSSFATLLHGVYEALLLSALQTATSPMREAIQSAQLVTSQVDPAGLATFFVVGLVSFIFGWLILRGDALPRWLGYLAIVNAVLLVVLFFATAANIQALILLSGGLTSVIVGPIWWIGIGLQLRAHVAPVAHPNTVPVSGR